MSVSSEKKLSNNKNKLLGYIGLVIIILILILSPLITKVLSYKNAISSFENKEYEIAIEQFKKLGDYADSNDYLFKSNCGLIQKYIESNEFYDAESLLDSLDKNQKEITELYHNLSKRCLETGNYEIAKRNLELIKDNIDVTAELQETDYLKAVSLYNAGYYDDAMELFRNFDLNYKDVSKYIKSYEKDCFLGDWVFVDEFYIYKRAYTFNAIGAEITKEGISFLHNDGWKDFPQKYRIEGKKLIPESYDSGIAHHTIEYVSDGKLVYKTKSTSGKDMVFEMKRGKFQKRPAPSLGMTTEELRNSSWGDPEDINSTTTIYGVSEQWCYSGYRYVYLENGIVTAIQE